MEKEDKCLVSEAMDKCKCEMCKLSRKMREQSLKFYVQNGLYKIINKCSQELENGK